MSQKLKKKLTKLEKKKKRILQQLFDQEEFLRYQKEERALYKIVAVLTFSEGLSEEEKAFFSGDFCHYLSWGLFFVNHQDVFTRFVRVVDLHPDYIEELSSHITNDDMREHMLNDIPSEYTLYDFIKGTAHSTLFTKESFLIEREEYLRQLRSYLLVDPETLLKESGELFSIKWKQYKKIRKGN